VGKPCVRGFPALHDGDNDMKSIIGKVEDIENFSDLFHLRKDLGGRIIPSIPVLGDDGRFHLWVHQGTRLLEMPIGEPVESSYFAKAKASEADYFLEVLDFVYQRAVNFDVFAFMGNIENDVYNLAASLSKLELCYRSNEETVSRQRYITTEIEYIAYACRSLYDNFQRLVKNHWDSTRLLDGSITKRELKDSFAAMALNDEKPRDPSWLCKQYGLPIQWAEYYANEASFFSLLRKFRNDIDHLGVTPENVFMTEKGIAISANTKPFKDFKIWNESTFLPNNLAPLLPILSFIIKSSLEAMDRFTRLIKGIIVFPEDIAPGYRVFLRSPHSRHLEMLERYINTDVWYNDSKA
jgi:hypothetical protein